MEQSEIEKVQERVVNSFYQGKLIMALEIAEQAISVCGKNKSCAHLHMHQGDIFSKLATDTVNTDMKCTYLLGSVESFSKFTPLFSDNLVWFHGFAIRLFHLGELLASNTYYEKAATAARQGLSLQNPAVTCGTQILTQETINGLKNDLKELITSAEGKMNPDVTKTVKKNESIPMLDEDVPKGAETRESKTLRSEKLRSFWAGLSVQSKREFLIVDIGKLNCYVEEKSGSGVRKYLESVLEFCLKRGNWRQWMCHSCGKSFNDCVKWREHIEQKHAEKFSPPEDLIPQIDKSCHEIISSGNWMPVDTTKAAEMIRDRILHATKFRYDKGWSTDWPSANDIDRRTILQEFEQILKSLLKDKILSSSLWDWFKEFIAENIEMHGVPRCCMVDCGLVNTPQCLCFLRHDQLQNVLGYFKYITTDICMGVVSRGVDRFWEKYRVKEKIHCDNKFSCLFLDRRLLRGKADLFDDEGELNNQSSRGYYGWVIPQDDETVSWLLDCPPDNEVFVIQRSFLTEKFPIWLAVLRIIESKCRKLETKYKTKLNMQAYSKGLMEVQKLCDEQEKHRKKSHYCWTPYAHILFWKCQDCVEKDGRNFHDTIGFLSVVRDVLEEQRLPRYNNVLKVEEYMKSISEHKNLEDDSVMETLSMLKIQLRDKFYLIDTKILLNEKSRIQLIDGLQKLSIDDHRSFVLPLLKCFLREELEKMREMDAKERSVAGETKEQEEKKKSK